MPVWLACLGGMAGIGAALGGYALFYEPYRVRSEQLVVHLLRDRAGLPAKGLRILHLSDTHFYGANHREHAKIAQVRRITADTEIDLIIHTGDFVHNDNGLENLLTLMDNLPQSRLGFFAVLGNHDYVVYEMKRALHYTWQKFKDQEENNGTVSTRDLTRSRRARFSFFLRFVRYLLHNRVDGEPTGVNDIARSRSELERRGVRFLNNQAVQLEGMDVYLVGVEDMQEGQPDLSGGLQSVPEDTPTILLSHNPDIIGMSAVNRADLILAGHTHGGQIVLPLLGPTHTQSELLSRSKASGHLRLNDTHIYIHRGLGEGIPIRFRAPPHVTFITVLPAHQPGANGYQASYRSVGLQRV